MKTPLRDTLLGLRTIFVGMRITLAEFFRKPVTLHYPREALKMAPRYRGHIILVKDQENPSRTLCIACKSCEKACPSDCIVVEGIKREGEKRKSVTDFKLDFTKCSLCGSCVEVCPTDALAYSKEYNLASLSKTAYCQIDLVKRFDEENR